MITKKLAMAAALALMTGFCAAPASAQATDQAAPAATAAAPAAGQQVVKAAAPGAVNKNPYGLAHILAEKNPVSYTILGILLVMSVGTWYIFFVKFFEQSRILGQAKTVEKRFWTSASLNEGIEKLPKTSEFRALAEAGVRASQGGTTLVGLNDWIGMTLARQLEDANGKLAGGISWLASVGSVAPFVGLFGTVWGILQALISIGVAGQASIDKVAGPVGEALIMTAIGLAAAVPAVLLYNFLVRRNKIITEKYRGFAGDLQTYLISKGSK
ncbi:biopolymer transport protein ExbB [Rhizomicrobium palustre]|uniref:Biopolymer transport protein ExbB n=1 Tax=Rhizomicrobium palustre TaxID=189966 RepID=A0A846MZ13_9PROT|nr:MotA/TolQ/ExbB proton channel family protein [Rhizomicrobium palustre]NIK88553.1 biopolymer transport protein ExbB [Rhizomicrobium palustre]